MAFPDPNKPKRGYCRFCGISVAFDYCEKCLRAWVSIREVNPAVLEHIIRFVHMERLMGKDKKKCSGC